MNQIEKKVFQVMKNIENRVSIPQKGSGWINLSDLGGQLRNNGIDYSKLGYEKLKFFISSIAGLELYQDDRFTLPVIYVRETVVKKDVQPSFSQKQTSPDQALMDWAFMGYIPSTMRRLKEMALEENWGRTKKDEEGKECYPTNEKGEEYYPILNNYLKYTFYKLLLQDKGISYKDGYAVFNTGLVDHRYKDIYALFKENKDPNKPQKWYWVDFCIQGEERAGKTLVEVFTDNEMPPKAHYFKQVTDMLYVATTGKLPSLDSHHILIERVHRLPLDFIKSNAPQNFDVLDPMGMSGEERKQYFANLGTAIKNDYSAYRQMEARLEDALKISIKRVEWNYKSAIPMYYPRKDKMCLFLPLCLVKENEVDVALVVEKTPSGRYLGSTVYELNWAYKCARLVCRPDSDWLTIAAASRRLLNESDE